MMSTLVNRLCNVYLMAQGVNFKASRPIPNDLRQRKLFLNRLRQRSTILFGSLEPPITATGMKRERYEI